MFGGSNGRSSDVGAFVLFCAERVFMCSWCIAYAPILLQQGLLRLHNKYGINRFDPRVLEHGDTLNTFLTKLCHMANDVLRTVRQSVEDGVNTFTIDHNWQEPTRALPANPLDGRKHLRRKDPLSFPDVPPPFTQIGRASCRERLVWCRSRWSPYH